MAIPLLLTLIAALLAALVLIQYRAFTKPLPVPPSIPAPAPSPLPRQVYAEHDVELHKAYRKCASCNLVVARYDERGICANCVSEGK